jgi:hypothetical protein
VPYLEFGQARRTTEMSEEVVTLRNTAQAKCSDFAWVLVENDQGSLASSSTSVDSQGVRIKTGYTDFDAGGSKLNSVPEKA